MSSTAKPGLGRLRLNRNGILLAHRNSTIMSGHAKKKKGIQLQEKILLVTTFLIGMVAGWYLYITAFAPQFNDFVGQTEAVYEDLVVVGDQYGGRRAFDAPSFQVLKIYMVQLRSRAHPCISSLHP